MPRKIKSDAMWDALIVVDVASDICMSSNQHKMLVRIRLQRFGRTHCPFYRMVAANSKAPRDGKFLEVIGTYNPIANSDGVKEIRLKQDRIQYWISVGAQPSDRVAWILGKFGVLPMAPKKYNPQKMIPKSVAAEAKKTAKK
jgi:small subunit ribosomal protein S16